MFTLQRNGRPTITPSAGERKGSRLIQGVQSQYVTLAFRGELVIAGGVADALRNRGSILAAFDEVGISADGDDVQLFDGRVLGFASEMAAPSARSVKRVTSTAAATYTLEELVRVYFAHPFAAIPRETAFREKDKDVLFEVFVKLAAGAATVQGQRLAKVSGVVTATLQTLSVQVFHAYDPFETAAPVFIPTVRQLREVVPGSNTKHEIFLETTKPLRQIIVTQETATDGEVADIINKLALKGDFGDIIGPEQVDIDDLILDAEYEFGGAVTASNRSHIGFNFQQHGRLASILTKEQNHKLRLLVDDQVSVAGAGTSRLIVTLFELERAGWESVVAKEVPFPY